MLDARITRLPILLRPPRIAPCPAGVCGALSPPTVVIPAAGKPGPTLETNMRVARNFVNGQFIEPAGAALIPVCNPATEVLIAQVCAATKDEAVAAVEAAATAQKLWRKLPSTQRAACMHKLADAL